MKHHLVAVKMLLVVIAILGAALPAHRSFAESGTGTSAGPLVTLGYYNALPGFDFSVNGQSFTPHGRADVFILENGQLLRHDVVGINGQGAFTDDTALACDFQPHVAKAYDRRSGRWSNTATLSGPCPG